MILRWQTVAPICPLVAGLPREDGEYILTRISSIAAAAGAPVAGLSRWDQAFLKALYHTEHTDRQQLAEIKTAMAEEIAPR